LGWGVTQTAKSKKNKTAKDGPGESIWGGKTPTNGRRNKAVFTQGGRKKNIFGLGKRALSVSKKNQRWGTGARKTGGERGSIMVGTLPKSPASGGPRSGSHRKKRGGQNSQKGS